MEARRRTWFDDRGLVIARPDGERHVPFYAGAMHYWRVPPARWAACLRQLHAQGLTIVETYVPWRIHEIEPGRFEWSGAADLARFLALAREAGLAGVLRPGPQVNAELTCFGLPDHVVVDPHVQARTARGTAVWMPSPPRAWPVPSYASAAFRVRVQAWFAAFAEVVAPFVGDPVVAIGVDNEAQMFFRLGAYDWDYHPDAIAWWNESSGLDGDPPRAWDPANAAACALWVRFKDHYIARAIGELAAVLDDVGLAGVARFHNLPPGHFGHYDLRAIQHALHGPVGIDAYTPRASFVELRRRAISCVANASPIPIAFEVGIGFFPWFPPLSTVDDPHRERDHLLTLLAAGMRGFNLFMAVERERYYGAAITRDGELERHASWIAPVVAALGELDWPALRRTPQIALVDTRADARFGLATALLDPMTPLVAEALGLGPGGAAELDTDPSAIGSRRWQAAIASALELAQIPYAIVDESASEDELAQYRAVIVPTLSRVDHGLWERICALADHKRAVVVIGPGTPTTDELDQPLTLPAPRRVGRLKAGSLDDVRGLADDLTALAGELPDVWQVERPEGVRVHAFGDAERVRAVFVLSDVDKPTTATVLADRPVRDVVSGEHVAPRDGRVQIALAPRGVRMFVVG
ncbi:MAG TPA: beta-galactosidase [Kofleriaceae bacterium]|nr:beta-galactosidase [Kofleriaceae bacterium]